MWTESPSEHLPFFDVDRMLMARPRLPKPERRTAHVDHGNTLTHPKEPSDRRMSAVPHAHLISTAKAVAQLPAPANGREEADGYQSVVAILNASWRVIDCRDRLQWILQRKAGYRHGQPRWDGRSYCRTREGLLRCVRALSGRVEPSAEALLHSLPDRHP